MVVSVTVIGAKVAQTGTVTINCVEFAVDTVAFNAPKWTLFTIAVALKFVPAVVPIGPEIGVKEVIAGA